MKKIMVRADDLGYCEGVNYGIAKSVHDGIIKNVGVMVNMPSVEHGLALLEDVDVCYGQHTNICVGKPITDPSLIPSITNAFGEFKSSKEYRNTKEDFVNLDEVIIEIEAQYERFVQLIGRKPQYFEGHAVASMNFFKGLEIVAQRHDLKYSGVSFDGSPIQVHGNNVYMWMDSMSPTYDPLAYFKNMVHNQHEDGYDMMICHPGYLDDYILKTSSLTIPRTLEVEAMCSEEIRKFIQDEDVKLFTYEDL